MWCYKAFPQKGSCDYAMKRFVEYQFYILIPDIFDFIVFFFFFRKEELKRKPIKWHSRRKKPDRRSRCWTWGQMFKAWSFSSCLPGLCRHWLFSWSHVALHLSGAARTGNHGKWEVWGDVGKYWFPQIIQFIQERAKNVNFISSNPAQDIVLSKEYWRTGCHASVMPVKYEFCAFIKNTLIQVSEILSVSLVMLYFYHRW